jgi:hypothetical protein
MLKPEPLIATRVIYYSPNDETAFFQWLGRVDCVEGFEGSGPKLFIDLKRAPTDDELRDLLALFYRYKIDMRQLAQFDQARRASWFRDPQMYWYRRVFGPAVLQT